MTSLSVVLRSFFPFLSDFETLSVSASKDFQWSLLKSVNVSTISFQRKEKFDFLLFCIPEGTDIHIPFLDTAAYRSELALHFKTFGYEAEKFEMKKGSLKDLSSAGETVLKGRIIFTFKKDNKILHMFIPEYFLSSVLRMSAVFSDGAEEIEDSEIMISSEIDRLELGLIHTGNRLHIHWLSYLKKLKEPSEISILMNSLLSKGILEDMHIASLSIHYPEFQSYFEHMPEKTRTAAEKFVRLLKPINDSSDMASARRWKAALDYEMQNVLSDILFNPDKESSDLTSFEVFIGNLDSKILQIRNAKREQRTPANSLLQFFAERKNSSFLALTEIKNLLALLHILGFKADFPSIFKPFKEDYKNNFYAEAKKQSLLLKEKSHGDLSRMLSEKIFLFYSLAEKHILSSISAARPMFGMKMMHEKLNKLSSEQIIILYNRLGFEKFTSVFEVFSYSESSALSNSDAEKFFMEMSEKLPYTERLVVQDIFYERINKDRIITENIHDKIMKEASVQITFLEDYSEMEKK